MVDGPSSGPTPAASAISEHGDAEHASRRPPPRPACRSAARPCSSRRASGARAGARGPRRRRERRRRRRLRRPRPRRPTTSRRRGASSSGLALRTTAYQPRPRATWLARCSATPRISQPGATPATASTRPSMARSMAAANSDIRCIAYPRSLSARRGDQVSLRFRRVGVLPGSRPALRRSSRRSSAVNGQTLRRSAAVATVPSAAMIETATSSVTASSADRPRPRDQAAAAVALGQPVVDLEPRPRRALALPVARGEDQRAAGAQHARHRGQRRAAIGGVRERVADAEDRVEVRGSGGSASHAHTRACTSTPWSAASARVRSIIAGLASLA